ncbi:MAG: helix-turn-helix domain-containing protein, partial [Aquificaceae bacterium]
RITTAKQTAMYFCKTMLNMSYSEIAKLFGKRDHTYALYSVKKVEEKKHSDRKFNYMLRLLEKNIGRLLERP